MESESWTLTFVDAHPKNTVPAAVRVRALLKHAGRYLRLRCVADVPLRRTVLEECYRALCPDCAGGESVRLELGCWWHPGTGHLCGARALRLAQIERRATDAGSMEDAPEVQSLPDHAQSGG